MRPVPSLPLVAVLALVGAGTDAPLFAQTIPIRTVPVATGDQFLVHPSLNLGMGGVTVALDDPWLDPFLNPAAGVRLGGSAFLASPTLYGIEGDAGAGRTIPLTALLSGQAWFGGVSVALQQIVDADEVRAWPAFRAGAAIDVWAPPPSRGGGTNTYASGFLGRRAGRDWSLGIGGSVAQLNAVDGVDLLYAGSHRIDQDGSAWDLRAGVVGELGRGRRVEAAIVHERFAARHDVAYLEWLWIPARFTAEPFERIEENHDRTRTTGAHAAFTAPVGETWDAGAVFTVNRKSHPAIPNYDLAQIPRDPGDSWAFNVGAGLGHRRGPIRFGVDVVYEPVWSETWAEAADTVRTVGGALLRPGDRTVENDFFLSNLHLRLGLARESARWGFQLGLQASSHETELEQWDVIAATRRAQDESWMEWRPSVGAVVRFPELEIRYAGWITTGTGRPSVDLALRGDRALAAEAAADFVVAPAGPLLLHESRVLTHQLTVRLPLR